MMIGIITDKKDANIEKLEKAFEEKNIPATTYSIGRLALFTRDVESVLMYGKERVDISGALIRAEPNLAQFVEPLVDILISKGAYCNIRPNAYYTLSNLPLVYAMLNSCKIPITKTHMVATIESLENAIERFSFPVIIKVFVKNKKTQSIVIDSKRGFSSFIKSIKGKVDAITLQEFLEGDLTYVAVVGEKTFAVKRKWDKNRFEHQKKKRPAAISETESKIAISALKNIGLDIGIVKLIEGKVVGMRPYIDFIEFEKVLGKNVALTVAEYCEAWLK